MKESFKKLFDKGEISEEAYEQIKVLSTSKSEEAQKQIKIFENGIRQIEQ